MTRSRPPLSHPIARWTAAALTAFCWAFALAVRFSSFSITSRANKATILGLLLIPTAFLAAWLFLDLLPGIFAALKPKAMLKPAALGALAAAALLLLFYQPPPFPEHHLLEISPYPPSGQGRLEVISVHRVELPGGEKLVVPPVKMDLQGDWQEEAGSDVLTASGSDAKLGYARLMQAGMEIAFRSGPAESGARVLWDGQEYLLDLTAPAEGQQVLLLPPALDWQRADLNRKILVGGALLAEFLGLTALFSIAGALLYQAFFGLALKLRAAIPLLLCLLALALLLTAVTRINPPAYFQDEQFEMAVRDMLQQPVGPIHQNTLRTIAELDASQRGIVSLAGIEQLRNLVSLNLRGNLIEDISPLSSLKRLQSLNLRDNPLQDITPLAELANLQYLNLHSNHRVRSLAPLQNLTNLQTLILAHVPVGEQVGILRNMPNLSTLNLRDSGISDLSVLSQLMAGGALQDRPAAGRAATLDLRGNPIPAPLSGSDPYAAMRPYWENIFFRQPFELPPVHIQPPEFSRPGGFYPAAFSLELSPSHPQDMIYYTLDGSEPDMLSNPESTHRYQAPIPVSRRTGYRLPVNADDAARLSEALYYGAQVVRAVSVNSGQQASQVVTHTYMIDENFTQNIQLPVISITTDPHNLFDDEAGIYVKGMVYDQNFGYVSERYPQEEHYNYPANYHQRGRIYLPIGGVEVQPFDDSQVAIPLPDHGLELDFDYWRTVPLITISGSAHYDGSYYLSPDSDKDILVIPKAYYPEVFPAGALIIRDWERPVHMEFFESDGSLAFSQNLGMRIHGGASRAASQKSLRFYARADYDPQDTIHYRLFPDDPTDRFQRFILRLTNQRSGLNDIIGQQLMQAAHPGMDIQRYRPVMVFINGDFWGWYSLRDRYDDRYLALKYGIEGRDVAYLEEVGVIKYGRPEDVDDFMEMDAFIRGADLTDDAAFVKVTTLMDVENYTDYLLTGIYLNYRDWGPKHDQHWRYTGEALPSHAPSALDGRWRWMPIDLDLSMVHSARSDYLSTVAYSSGNYLPNFLENEQYRAYFINRFADLINTVFREEAAAALVQGVLDELPENVIQEHIKRWQNHPDLDSWMADVEVIRTYLNERPQYMRGHIVDYFGLDGSTTLTLLTDSSRGFIRVNTVTISPDTPGVEDADQWSGVYFKGVPLTVSAIPKPGYRFIGWEGIEQADAEITLTLDGDLTLKANFIPVEP